MLIRLNSPIIIKKYNSMDRDLETLRLGAQQWFQKKNEKIQKYKWMKNLQQTFDDILSYMQWGGLSDKFEVEKEVEEDLLLWIACGIMETIVKNQVVCDSEVKKNEDFYLIDLVIKTSNGYFPIEIKHVVSATKENIKDDMKKLDFYTRHYSDMPVGLFVYYTDKERDALTKGLIRVQNILDKKKSNFYYRIIMRDSNKYNSYDAISFDERWEAKEMK